MALFPVKTKSAISRLAAGASGRVDCSDTSALRALPPGSGVSSGRERPARHNLSADDPWLLIWFSAEQAETVNWAGNPHKAATSNPNEQLTPRASFDAWHETVRGRARSWTLPEIDAAG